MRKLASILIVLFLLSSCMLDENGLAPNSNPSGQNPSSGSTSGTMTSSGSIGGEGGASASSSSSGGGSAGGGSTGGQPPCHPAGLQDGFDGTAVDTTIWNTQGEQSIMSVTGSQLQVTPQNNVDDGQWVGLVTAAKYDLTACSVWIEAPSIVKKGAAGNTYWQLYSPDGSSAFKVSNGMLEAKVTDMGADLGVASVAYVAAEHRWWRIREDAGKLIMETSPDFINWKTLLSAPTPLYISQVAIGLGVISPQNEMNLGQTTFDNFNIVP